MSPIAIFKTLFGPFYSQLRKSARAIVYHPRRAVTAFLLVLWTCRVSVIALAGPAFVLAMAPQGRDLISYFAGHMVASPGSGILFLGEIYTVGYWSVMCGLTLAFWSYPVHGSARVLMYFPDWLFGGKRNPRNSEIRRVRLLYRPLIVWIPRLLGATPFVILAFAASWARDDLPGPVLVGTVTEDTTGEFRALLYFLEIVFYLCAALTLYFFVQIRGPEMLRRTPNAMPFAPRGAPLIERYRAALGGEGDIETDFRFSRGLLVAITVALLAVLFGPPHLIKNLYLAWIVPFVAGAWVPFFTWLVWNGQRFRLPVAAAFFVALAALTTYFGDNHDISRAAAPVEPRVTVAAAIDKWKAANCHGACPRPIIVSTAGGASRAAFFTLTVLGALMDDATIVPASRPADPHAAARRVASRLFAISAVSGGSAGAVIYAAALANSPDGAQPCNAQESSFWFKAGAPTGWRDCLQAITAEDFLSETIAGLAFRDNLNFLARVVTWPDRAVVLEQSFAQAFEKWVRKPNGPPFLGLDRPFTSFGVKTGGEWRPLLAINGTSVTTGRRILTSHFAPAGPAPVPASAGLGVGQGKDERLFMDAYDLHDLLAQIDQPAAATCGPKDASGCDVQLATAATNSARFPIISPPGVLRRADHDRTIADRIVDGGYFENDGATTTTDLARALLAAGLHPAVIHIANDPLPYPRKEEESKQVGAAGPTAAPGPAAPEAEGRSWFLFLRGPLGSLFATRSARASYALSDLELLLGSRNQFAEILVFGEPKRNLSPEEAPLSAQGCFEVQPPKPGTELKEVSMSWWLSQPVQAYLDAQLRIARNCEAVDKIRGWLREEAFSP